MYNVHAQTWEECEEKLKGWILGDKGGDRRPLLRGKQYPDGVSPKKKAAPAYLRKHPGVARSP